MTAEKNIMRNRHQGETPEFEERVIEVNRISRTVKGGRRIRFRALVVVGNRKGKVGAGVAKANDVTEAVSKAVSAAKKHIVEVPIIDGTIPYETVSKYGSAVVMLKPAASGTSIVAGGSVRTVCELAGISDILSKIQGSQSKINNVMATLQAISSFKESYVKKIRSFSEKLENALPKSVTTEKTAPLKKETVEKTEAKKAPRKESEAKKTTKKITKK